MFSAQTYIDRRERLIASLSDQSGLLVFWGNALCPMNYTDNTFPFRQDSSFLYYFGLDRPSLAAVIDLDEGTQTLYGNDLTVEEIVWMGVQPDLQQLAQRCGLTNADSLEHAFSTLRRAHQKQRCIHLLPQYQPANRITLAGVFEESLENVDRLVSEPFTRAVIAMRSVKSAEEIEQIEQALAVSDRMHRIAMQTARPGRTESQVVADMEQVVIGHNCRMAFPVIFTTHGETLHNHYGGTVLAAGDIVINDSGAENPMRYASDITRTIPVSGRFSDRQRPIYELVLQTLNRAMESIAPGIPFRDIHLQACRMLTEGLIGLGLMKGNAADAVQAGAHALFFPCGLGHMMGLDVHDMEGLGEDWVGYTDRIQRSDQFGLRSLRLARELQPGFVLTVEPGIYFIPPLIEQWQQQNRFTDYLRYDTIRKYQEFGGIRIEDNVLVTDDGHRVMSRDIPKSIEQVKTLCG